VKITADQYPYVQSAPYGPIYSFMSVPEDLAPFAELREKLRNVNSRGATDEDLVEQYIEEIKKALNDESKRERIKKMTVEGLPHDPSPVAIWGWHDNSVIISDKYSHLVGKNFVDIFEELGGDPFDVIADFVLNEPDMLYAGGSMSEDEVQLALKQEWVMVSSDGGAVPLRKENDEPKRGHPRDFGSFTKVFRKYVREENVLSLEDAVRKMTSLPASVLGMTDRGRFVKGHKADIAIFNPETVKDNATYADSERYSSGIEHVMVNGRLEIENGEYTGDLHGKVLLLTDQK
jgi:N-acyl-D-aspartate/D-glutamate deacylase